jgi:hypothetical protein
MKSIFWNSPKYPSLSPVLTQILIQILVIYVRFAAKEIHYYETISTQPWENSRHADIYVIDVKGKCLHYTANHFLHLGSSR